MTPAELADSWDAYAAACDETAQATRSLDVHARSRARAAQFRHCAYQLRLTLGLAARNGVPVTAVPPSGPGGDFSPGTEHAVFWGGPDPDNAAGMEFFPDPGDAEEDAQWRVSGGVAQRPVFRGPWTVTVAPGAAQEHSGCCEGGC